VFIQLKTGIQKRLVQWTECTVLSMARRALTEAEPIDGTVCSQQLLPYALMMIGTQLIAMRPPAAKYQHRPVIALKNDGKNSLS
jgi:hypothetical protein